MTYNLNPTRPREIVPITPHHHKPAKESSKLSACYNALLTNVLQIINFCSVSFFKLHGPQVTDTVATYGLNSK